MEVPIREDMATQNAAVEIRLEERTRAEFDLSGANEYVDLQDIDGRLILELDVNRGALMDMIDRAEDPGIKDQLNMFLEDWGLRDGTAETLELNYGTLLLEGTEPVGDLDRQVPLEKSVERDRLEETSPSDMRRELRQEITYETNHDELVEDIKAYLDREGINPDDFEFGEPFQIKAQAEAVENTNEDLFGTEFTIAIKNQRVIGRDPVVRGERKDDPMAADHGWVRVDMPPEIGREVEDDTTSYDPSEEQLEIRIDGIPQGVEREVSFVVPASAGRDLERLAGEVEIQMRTPFTYLAPTAVFDPSGRRIRAGEDTVSLATSGTFEAGFETPTSAIMKRDIAEISKGIQVEGITPPEAREEVENILRRRGISAEFGGMKEEKDMREGVEVRKFNADWLNGSVLVEDTRISVDIYLSGHRSAGERRAATGDDEEDLPTTEQSVAISYGVSGIDIQGRGADYDKVDDYISELRDEIQLRLQNAAMEV